MMLPVSFIPPCPSARFQNSFSEAVQVPDKERIGCLKPVLNWGTLWRSALDPLFAVGWTVGQPVTRGRRVSRAAGRQRRRRALWRRLPGASAPPGRGTCQRFAEAFFRSSGVLSLRALLEVSGDGHGNVTEAGHHGCLQLGPATAAVAAALSGLDLAVHRRVSEVGVQDLTATEAKEGSQKSGCTGPARSCRNS